MDIWQAIEMAAAALAGVPGFGVQFGRVLRVAGVHLRRKHGKEINSLGTGDLGLVILSAMGCGARRLAFGQDQCPHEVDPEKGLLDD